MFENRTELIRTLSTWNQKTFGKAFQEMDKRDIKMTILVKKVLEFQELSDRPMNGYCSESLKKKEFERMGPAYVSYFNKLEQSGKPWTPLDIIREICIYNLGHKEFYNGKVKEYGLTFEEITSLMCGRALRALPSYIREHQLRFALERTFPDARFYQNEELDKKYHCDILMKLNGKTYFVWSFISSSNSIPQFADKFQNNRFGCIKDGYHLLCPFERKKEEAMFYGWALYTKDYMNEIKDAIQRKETIDYKNLKKENLLKTGLYHHPVVVCKNDSFVGMSA